MESGQLVDHVHIIIGIENKQVPQPSEMTTKLNSS